jgi:hypothetical protein
VTVQTAPWSSLLVLSGQIVFAQTTDAAVSEPAAP